MAAGGRHGRRNSASKKQRNLKAIPSNTLLSSQPVPPKPTQAVPPVGDQVFTSEPMWHILSFVCVWRVHSHSDHHTILVGFPSSGVLRTLSSGLQHYEASLSRCSHLRDVCLPFPSHAHCQSQIHSKGKENFREDPIRVEPGALKLLTLLTVLAPMF